MTTKPNIKKIQKRLTVATTITNCQKCDINNDCIGFDNCPILMSRNTLIEKDIPTLCDEVERLERILSDTQRIWMQNVAGLQRKIVILEEEISRLKDGKTT